jgi:hypothetical protein
MALVIGFVLIISFSAGLLWYTLKAYDERDEWESWL